MTREQLAKSMGITRKTLYNYMQDLKINSLTDANIEKLKEYSKTKSKSKNYKKDNLLLELEQLRIKNAELEKQNERLEKGQEVLLEQIEYFKNDLNDEIRRIKESIVLLLPPPKKPLKTRLFDFLETINKWSCKYYDIETLSYNILST